MDIVYILVHLKRPMGIIHDRATYGRSCKLLEGGQLNKGEGGRKGKQRGKKGEVGREEKRK